MMTASPNRR